MSLTQVPFQLLLLLWVLEHAMAQMIKNLPANAEDPGLILESGRYPRERNGNSLQYSCLGNAVDIGDCWPTVYRLAKSQTQLSE